MSPHRLRRHRSPRGFTLLEVLIAVLIVGIIATAAIPFFSDYTAQARLNLALANVRTLQNAIDQYGLGHQAPLGWVRDTAQDPPVYVQYRPDGFEGILKQLQSPTDVNGNVFGEPVSSAPGAYALGPYLRGKTGPASLLLGAPPPYRGDYPPTGGYAVEIDGCGAQSPGDVALTAWRHVTGQPPSVAIPRRFVTNCADLIASLREVAVNTTDVQTIPWDAPELLTLTFPSPSPGVPPVVRVSAYLRCRPDRKGLDAPNALCGPRLAPSHVCTVWEMYHTVFDGKALKAEEADINKDGAVTAADVEALKKALEPLKDMAK